MMGIPDGRNSFKDTFSRFDTILACDWQTPSHVAIASMRYAYQNVLLVSCDVLLDSCHCVSHRYQRQKHEVVCMYNCVQCTGNSSLWANGAAKCNCRQCNWQTSQLRSVIKICTYWKAVYVLSLCLFFSPIHIILSMCDLLICMRCRPYVSRLWIHVFSSLALTDKLWSQWHLFFCFFPVDDFCFISQMLTFYWLSSSFTCKHVRYLVLCPGILMTIM